MLLDGGSKMLVWAAAVLVRGACCSLCSLLDDGGGAVHAVALFVGHQATPVATSTTLGAQPCCQTAGRLLRSTVDWKLGWDAP